MYLTLFSAVLVAHCCLTLVYNAPLRGHELTRAVENAMSLAKKILSDIRGAHDACVTSAGLTLSSEAKSLEYLLSDIGIPAPPVLKSEELTMETSLSRIVNGLELHRRLLEEVGVALSSSEELKPLLAGVRDLRDQVEEVQRLAQIPSPESQDGFPGLALQLRSDYQVQVAAHLTLQQLRSFTQDVFRTLRHISASIADPQ
ncbi:colony stimulating factor 3 (granulocyte) b [Rhinichthys klamathensis goyatoka]|uniref:colony stimulating factor 3 (granulocyte) b n=1 Tax=Rhinichthys klamathensis goyatoka TaxID=3034132 RepID=UPI0024B52106|nr:colony stimulating factor 3 (granulocyte) b [Rhinichthys klamathensis goyatoka]